MVAAPPSPCSFAASCLGGPSPQPLSSQLAQLFQHYVVFFFKVLEAGSPLCLHMRLLVTPDRSQDTDLTYVQSPPPHPLQLVFGTGLCKRHKHPVLAAQSMSLDLSILGSFFH